MAPHAPRRLGKSVAVQWFALACLFGFYRQKKRAPPVSQENKIKHVSVEIKFRTVSGYTSRDLISTRHSVAPGAPRSVLRNALREVVRLLTLEGADLAELETVVSVQHRLTVDCKRLKEAGS